MKITEQQLRQVIKEEIDAQVTVDDFNQISRKLSKLYRSLDDMYHQKDVMEIRKQLVALRKRVTGE